MSLYSELPSARIPVTEYVGKELRLARLRSTDALQKQNIAELEEEIQQAIHASVDRRHLLEELFELRGENRRTERRLENFLEREHMLTVAHQYEVSEENSNSTTMFFIPRILRAK